MVKIFIGNLNEDSDPAKLRGLFEAFGTVTECDILSKYGFVHMDSEAEANQAIQALNGHDLDGVKVDVKLSNKSGQPRGGRDRGGGRGGSFGSRSGGSFGGRGSSRGSRGGSSRTVSARELGPGPVKLFIGNLSEDTKSEDLRALFEQYGEVYECAVLNRYGFVHMVNPDDADAAIEGLQRYKLDGFAINVELSHGKGKGPRDDERPRGGGRTTRAASRSARSSSRYDPYGRDDYPPDPYDRPLPPPPGYDRDPYGRLPPPPRDPYDAYRRDPYARDPYGREDPYRRARDPYERDPYEAYRRDPYLYARARDPYARERDPYAREPRDPYAATRERDPYARPPPTYYDYETTRRPAVDDPPAAAYDPYSTARRAAPVAAPTSDPYAQIPSQIGQDPLKEMGFSSNGY